MREPSSARRRLIAPSLLLCSLLSIGCGGAAAAHPQVNPGFRGGYGSVAVIPMSSGGGPGFRQEVANVLEGELMACGIRISAEPQAAELVIALEHGGGALPWQAQDTSTGLVVATGRSPSAWDSKSSAKQVGRQICGIMGGTSVAGPSVAASPTTSVAIGELLQVAPQHSAYAVVVGIGRYRNPDIVPAEGADADAKSVEALLTHTFGIPGDHVKVLVNEYATRLDIERALKWLKEESGRGSRIYFYFSGHGAPDPSKGTPFLVPYDGDPNDLDTTALRVDEILARLEDTQANDAVAIVDACFTGGGGRSVIAKGVRPLTLAPETKPRAKTVLLAAADANQIASSDRSGRGGLFTAVVIDALGEGRADIDGDGAISLAELETWTTGRVRDSAADLGREQTPKFTLGKGVGPASDFMLGWGYPRQ